MNFEQCSYEEWLDRSIEDEMMKLLQDEIQREIDLQFMKSIIPRYEMMECLKKYKSDFNNCNLKEYKEVKDL